MSAGATAIEVPRLVQPYAGDLEMPGSKSHANRALVAACLADGTTEIVGATPCDDVALMVDNLRRMGFAVRWTDRARGQLSVVGGIPEARSGTVADRVELDCELAGTTLRFLTALACLVPGEWIVTGNARMRERPIGALVDALSGLGADVRAAGGGCPPVRVRGGPLGTGSPGPGGPAGHAATIDPSRSSQFLSALMLIGPALDGGLRIALERPSSSRGYLELTARVLRDFGAVVDLAAERVEVRGPLRAPSARHECEGDWSAAGAFVVLGAITGSAAELRGLRPDSVQADRRVAELVERLGEPGDDEIDAAETPDQVMNLAVFAAHRRGRTRIRGAHNLRHKESDRLAVLASELAKAGVRIVEHDDGVEIEGPARLRPAELDPHGDHRMAMAFAVLGATADGIRILDPGCVSKSYPRFFDDLSELCGPEHARPIALVGMRGSGKTTLARDLAAESGLRLCDTDEQFVQRHGPIAGFVAQHGWPAFRAREAELVDELRGGRGIVIALGGGAVETPAVRAALQRRTGPLVVWVRESADVLRQRIAADGGARPSLTGADPADEIDSVLARREPLYRDVAHFVLPEGLSPAQRVQRVRAWLRWLVSFERNTDGVE